MQNGLFNLLQILNLLINFYLRIEVSKAH